MAFDIENDTYTPDFLEDMQDIQFEPKLIAWINDPQINQDISIET